EHAHHEHAIISSYELENRHTTAQTRRRWEARHADSPRTRFPVFSRRGIRRWCSDFRRRILAAKMGPGGDRLDAGVFATAQGVRATLGTGTGFNGLLLID